MKQALPLIGAFLFIFIGGAVILYVSQSPTLSKLDWGALITGGIIVGLLIAAVASFGGKRVLLFGGLIIILIVVVGVISMISSAMEASAQLKLQEDLLEAQANATATAIQNSIPPDTVRIYKPAEMSWEIAWGIITIAAALVTVAMAHTPKTLTLLVATYLYSAAYHDTTMWMSAVAVTFVIAGVGRFLLSIFGLSVAVVTHFSNIIFGMVFAAILAAITFMMGGVHVWTVLFLAPKTPEAWMIILMSVVNALIFLGVWPSPPDV